MRDEDQWNVSVVIPVRNEEDLLARCLHSVLAAGAKLPAHASFDVTVVIDSSTDFSYRIASEIVREEGVVMRVDAGIVGAARAIGVASAMYRCARPNTRCWIASTDADCLVPVTWLADQLRLAEQGMEAVAGIVDVSDFSGHLPHVENSFRRSYITHADGSHPHVHGANMGFRADAYLRAGGWHGLATAEDHDLWKRLVAAGVKTISTSRLKVMTSGRRTGRAPHGFAAALDLHNESAA